MKFLTCFVVAFLFFANESRSQKTSPSELSGISDTKIFEFKDGLALQVNDPYLMSLLHRVQQISGATLQKYGRDQAETTLAEIAKDPRSFRCYVFQFSGSATFVESCTNASVEPDSNLRRFEIIVVAQEENFCIVAVPPSGRPQRWPASTDINQPVSLAGFFLGTYDFHPENPGPVVRSNAIPSGEYPVFVAKKLDWFPDQTTADISVSQSELLLSEFGVDVGNLDRVRENVLGNIAPESAQSFYQILDATNKIPTEKFPAETVDFKNCLQDPVKHQSAPLRLTGQARRVTKIFMEKSAAANFGINHYFQIDMFLPLNEHKIVYRSNRSDSPQEPLTIENRFPITLCVTDLPSSPDKMVGKKIIASGFFFQRWNYVSEKSSQHPNFAFQDAPLVIGLPPKILGQVESPLNTWIAIFAGCCLSTLLILYWAYGRTQSAGGPARSLPDTIVIDKLEP